MSLFKQFYKKTMTQRHEVLSQLPHMTEQDAELLATHQTLDAQTADTIIENCIGIYGIPLGVAPDFLINGHYFNAPMATEEPSVIAAASYGAKIIEQNGGFSAQYDTRLMIGQIALYNCSDTTSVTQTVLNHKAELLQLANDSYPSIVKRGGGAKDLRVETKTSLDHSETFVIVYLSVDTKEAMGANMLNTMLEHLRVRLEELTQTRALMSILSNYANQSLVHATCKIAPKYLHKSFSTEQGEIVRDNIVRAYQFASADIYRATTHNKGIMNGISAVVLASGNDTRAIEAGAHAFACQNGTYQPLTKWSADNDGNLIGSITLPLPIGFVGGSISIHPSAKVSQHLSNATDAKSLAQLIACVGLAQNLAALRALVSEGIQKGHMSLQLKSLALSIGATADEIPSLVAQLQQEPHANQDIAKELLKKIRQTR